MSDPQIETQQQALAHSVSRNSRMVLSLPDAGMVHNFKSRFLDQDQDGLWVELGTPDAELLAERLIQGGLPLAVTFIRAPRRLTFASLPIRIDQNHRLNDQSTVSALLVAAPTKFKESQRRAAHRVSVGPDQDLRVRVWAIAEGASINERPSARSEIEVALCDISVGGLGMRLVGDAAERKFVADQRLRVQLNCGDVEMLFDARLRLAPAQSGSGTPSAGIVFRKLEDDLEGRRKLAVLARIVGEFQRQELRRMRLGLAS